MQCEYVKLNAAHLLPFGYLDTLTKIVAIFLHNFEIEIPGILYILYIVDAIIEI